ncbi:hypothetical protein M885DRAFT_526006 [Pelagophyceae sp. CCMP2097]|nr:hypothetical protein M885DRAFT_526006 [Pelagophyceae sp. CCMP2097]
MASDKERREVMDWLNDSDDDDDDVSPQPAEVEAGQDDNKPAGAPDGAPVDGGGARGDEPADAPADGADADASNLDEEGGGDALSDAIADSAPEPCDAAFVDEEVAFPGAKEARESQASLRSMILDDDDDDDDDDGDRAVSPGAREARASLRSLIDDDGDNDLSPGASEARASLSSLILDDDGGGGAPSPVGDGVGSDAGSDDGFIVHQATAPVTPVDSEADGDDDDGIVHQPTAQITPVGGDDDDDDDFVVHTAPPLGGAAAPAAPAAAGASPESVVVDEGDESAARGDDVPRSPRQSLTSDDDASIHRWLNDGTPDQRPASHSIDDMDGFTLDAVEEESPSEAATPRDVEPPPPRQRGVVVQRTCAQALGACEVAFAQASVDAAEVRELWASYAAAAAEAGPTADASLASGRAAAARGRAWAHMLLGPDLPRDDSAEPPPDGAVPDQVLKEMRRDCSASAARIAESCAASVSASGGEGAVATAMLEVVTMFYALRGEYSRAVCQLCEPLFALHDTLSHAVAVAMLGALHLGAPPQPEEAPQADAAPARPAPRGAPTKPPPPPPSLRDRHHAALRGLAGYHAPALARCLDGGAGAAWWRPLAVGGCTPPLDALFCWPSMDVAATVRLWDCWLPRRAASPFDGGALAPLLLVAALLDAEARLIAAAPPDAAGGAAEPPGEERKEPAALADGDASFSLAVRDALSLRDRDFAKDAARATLRWLRAAEALEAATPRSFRDGLRGVDDGGEDGSTLAFASPDDAAADEPQKAADACAPRMGLNLSLYAKAAPAPKRRTPQELLRAAHDRARAIERRFAPAAARSARLAPRLAPRDVLPSLFGATRYAPPPASFDDDGDDADRGPGIRYFVVDVRRDPGADGRFPTARHITPADLDDAETRTRLLDEFEPLRADAHIVVMGAGAAYLEALAELSPKVASFAPAAEVALDAQAVATCCALLVGARFRRVAVVSGGFAATYAALFFADTDCVLRDFANEPALGLLDHATPASRPRACLAKVGVPLKQPESASATPPAAPSMNTFAAQSSKSASAMASMASSGWKSSVGVLSALGKAPAAAPPAPAGTPAAPAPAAPRLSMPSMSFASSLALPGARAAPAPAAPATSASPTTTAAKQAQAQAPTPPKKRNDFAIGGDSDDEDEPEAREASPTTTGLSAEDSAARLVHQSALLALAQHKVAGLRKGERVVFDSDTLPDTVLFACVKLKQSKSKMAAGFGLSGFGERRLLRCIGVNRERLIVFDTEGRTVATGAVGVVKSNHHLTELVKLTFPRASDREVVAMHLRAGFSANDADVALKANIYKIARHETFIKRLQERLARFR